MSDLREAVYEAPKLSISRKKREDKWLREERAFFLMLPELLKTLRGKWVAIHEEKVIETGETMRSVLLNVRKRLPNTEVYIQYVEDSLPTAKMLSPRRRLK